jgi:hypothetical protein
MKGDNPYLNKKGSNREIPTYPEIEGTFFINIHHI